MKAIYKTPKIRIVQINATSLMAASPDLGFDDIPVNASDARSKSSQWTWIEEEQEEELENE